MPTPVKRERRLGSVVLGIGLEHAIVSQGVTIPHLGKKVQSDSELERNSEANPVDSHSFLS